MKHIIFLVGQLKLLYHPVYGLTHPYKQNKPKLLVVDQMINEVRHFYMASCNRAAAASVHDFNLAIIEIESKKWMMPKIAGQNIIFKEDFCRVHFLLFYFSVP